MIPAKSKPETPEAFEILSAEIQRASEVMKAMAGETRLKIMCALSGGEKPVTELALMTGQSLPAVSQHLARLRAAKLVESRREAQTVHYRCADGIGRALVDTLCKYYA